MDEWAYKHDLKSELFIEQNLETGTITNILTHGVMSDGLCYDSNEIVKSGSEQSWVGKMIDRDSFTIECENDDKESLHHINSIIEEHSLHKWCVKCKLEDDKYVLAAGKHHDVWNVIATIP